MPLDPLIQGLLRMIAEGPRVIHETEQPPLAAEIDRLRDQITAILAAYDRALLDPAARIPTLLHAAIEAAR